MEPSYTGKGDSLLDFGGAAADFGSEANFDKVIQIKVSNTRAEDLKVILNPSYSPSDPTYVVKEGVIPYIAGRIDLAAVGSPSTVDAFLEFIKFNPTSVWKIQVKSNNAAQLSQAILIDDKRPWKAADQTRINIISSVSEFAQNDKLATIKGNFDLTNNHQWSVIVPALTETTFTFYLGATLSLSGALKEKRRIAMLNSTVQQTKAALNK